MSKYSSLGLAILLPFAVIGLYLQLGTPAVLFHSETLRPATVHATSEVEPSLPSVEFMLEQVQARLEEHPDDERGWSLLANAMMKLGRYSEAVMAYEQLFRLANGNPEVLVRYADALAMLAKGDLTGKPTALLEQALEIDPMQPQGLWLAGIAAEKRGDLAKAVHYWYRLEPLLTHESDALESIKQMIERALLEADTQNIPILPRPEISLDLVSPPTTPELSIRVRVEIAPTLAALVSENDSLFVFARAKNIAAPIAVVRQRIEKLPIELLLDNSARMMSASQLTDFDQIVIGARVSRSGNATPRSGDLTSNSVTINVQDSSSVRVTISRIIP